MSFSFFFCLRYAVTLTFTVYAAAHPCYKDKRQVAHLMFLDKRYEFYKNLRLCLKVIGSSAKISGYPQPVLTANLTAEY